MRGKGQEFRASLRIPDLRGIVVAAGRNAALIWREGKVDGIPRIAVQREQRRPSCAIQMDTSPCRAAASERRPVMMRAPSAEKSGHAARAFRRFQAKRPRGLSARPKLRTLSSTPDVAT